MVLFRRYTENWPKVGAVAAMGLGGASILAANRKGPIDCRALAIMNSMTMAAHQVEEYVEPGYFPGQTSRPRGRPLGRGARGGDAAGTADAGDRGQPESGPDDLAVRRARKRREAQLEPPVLPPGFEHFLPEPTRR